MPAIGSGPKSLCRIREIHVENFGSDIPDRNRPSRLENLISMQPLGDICEGHFLALSQNTLHLDMGRNPMKLKSRSILGILVLITLFAVSDMRGPAVITAQSPGRTKVKSNNLYIVQMSEVPVASYTGGTAGLRATKPGRGQKIDPN